MDKPTSFLDIQNAIRIVKEYKKGFITNFYPEVDKINTWIDNGQFHIEIMGDTAFFFRENAEFSYLFYCSTTTEALRHALFELKSMMAGIHLVADIIGKKPDVQSVVNAFEANGFYKYATLNRMSRNPFLDECRNLYPGIKKANLSHSKAVFNLLHQYFDPIAEQLPTQGEINEWIKSNHLLLFEENSEILGFVIFDLIGITSYLRYWFVHPQHRNKKVGSTLLNEYFKNCSGVKRQLFWVIQTNENAIKRYKHYGFLSENLYDFVVTNKDAHYETESN